MRRYVVFLRGILVPPVPRPPAKQAEYTIDSDSGSPIFAKAVPAGSTVEWFIYDDGKIRRRCLAYGPMAPGQPVTVAHQEHFSSRNRDK